MKFTQVKAMPPELGVEVVYDFQMNRLTLADGTPLTNILLTDMQVSREMHQVYEIDGTTTQVPGIETTECRLLFTNDPIVNRPIPGGPLDRDALVKSALQTLVDIQQIGK